MGYGSNRSGKEHLKQMRFCERCFNPFIPTRSSLYVCKPCQRLEIHRDKTKWLKSKR